MTSDRKLRVGVLFGGRSGEHEVSLVSAATVMEAIDPTKYEVVPIGIAKDGRWLLDGDPLRTLRDASAKPDAPAEPVTRLIPALGAGSIGHHLLDVVVPVLHGTFGEDGTVQGLLELAQLPYVGAGVLASAVGMDKAIMKDVFQQHGIPAVAAIALLRRRWRDHSHDVLADVATQIGFPCFVKPANLGSSVGISKVHNAAELAPALDEAAQYDRKILVEQAVQGAREIEVGVLGNDEPIVSVPGEIVPAHEFYDYAAKYIEAGSRLIIPADLPAETIRLVQSLAIAAFKALDCSGLARVDCFLSSPDGQLYVNELNTFPGFTRISMYPKLWEASGIAIGALLDRLIALAIERHEDRQSSRTSYR